jgi:hypothetical protein
MMNVTLAQLGAIGDFVGAIAVLITLFHLANQIKQNTRAVKATTQLAISAATTEVWRNNCIDFDRTKTFFELAKKEKRTAAEQSFVIGWIMQPVRQQENIYLTLKLDAIDSGFVDLDSRLHSLFGNKNSPHRRAWDNGELEGFLSADFVDYVDERLQRIG